MRVAILRTYIAPNDNESDGREELAQALVDGYIILFATTVHPSRRNSSYIEYVLVKP